MRKGKVTKVDYSKLDKHDRQIVARHEAAHATVAHHFRVEWVAKAIYCGPGTIDNKAWRGQLGMYRANYVPAFHLACIAWAGMVAEIMDDHDAPTDVWTIAINAFDARFDLPEEISATDEECIAGHMQPWRACQTATRVLLKRRDEWQWIEARLMESETVECYELIAAKKNGLTKLI